MKTSRCDLSRNIVEQSVTFYRLDALLLPNQSTEDDKLIYVFLSLSLFPTFVEVTV